MRVEAESHADEDKRKQDLAEARNKASMRIHQTEKILKENADSIDDGSKAAIDASLEKVKQVAESDDATAINTAVDELDQAAHALAEHMYKENSDAGAAPESDAESADADADAEDVIDAEFEKK